MVRHRQDRRPLRARREPQFRNWVTADGRPGPTGEGGFAAEPGRYHLYVSLACPWAHRTLIFRKLKGLEEAIGVSVVHWLMGEQGWTFEPGPGVHRRPARRRAATCTRSTPGPMPRYTGRVTVPVLWDKKRRHHRQQRVRPRSSGCSTRPSTGSARAPGDYYPAGPAGRDRRASTRASTTPSTTASTRPASPPPRRPTRRRSRPLFATLDWLEERLAAPALPLRASGITEADWRLFTTLLRFDPVYLGHFKCNLRRLVDYPNLWAYTRELYQWPGVAETVDFAHIKRHYYDSHATINPTGIVPLGPEIDLEAPPDRQLP